MILTYSGLVHQSGINRANRLRERKKHVRILCIEAKGGLVIRVSFWYGLFRSESY